MGGGRPGYGGGGGVKRENGGGTEREWGGERERETETAVEGAVVDGVVFHKTVMGRGRGEK